MSSNKPSEPVRARARSATSGEGAPQNRASAGRGAGTDPLKETHRILGLDPGSLHTGFGLVEKDGPDLTLIDAGRLSCPRASALPERLAQLAGGLTEILERAEPESVVLETPFHHRVHGNSRSLIVLAQARGALLAVLGGRGLEVREYSPAEVKSAVTGNGRADKAQVTRMVRLLLSFQGELSHDAADALAVAICAAKRARADRISALHGRSK